MKENHLAHFPFGSTGRPGVLGAGYPGLPPGRSRPPSGVEPSPLGMPTPSPPPWEPQIQAITISWWRRRLRGFAGDFQERLSPHSLPGSEPWLCSVRRGGPGVVEAQGQPARGDPPPTPSRHHPSTHPTSSSQLPSRSSDRRHLPSDGHSSRTRKCACLAGHRARSEQSNHVAWAPEVARSSLGRSGCPSGRPLLRSVATPLPAQDTDSAARQAAACGRPSASWVMPRQEVGNFEEPHQRWARDLCPEDQAVS